MKPYLALKISGIWNYGFVLRGKTDEMSLWIAHLNSLQFIEKYENKKSKSEKLIGTGDNTIVVNKIFGNF